MAPRTEEQRVTCSSMSLGRGFKKAAFDATASAYALSRRIGRSSPQFPWAPFVRSKVVLKVSFTVVVDLRPDLGCRTHGARGWPLHLTVERRISLRGFEADVAIHADSARILAFYRANVRAHIPAELQSAVCLQKCFEDSRSPRAASLLRLTPCISQDVLQVVLQH